MAQDLLYYLDVDAAFNHVCGGGMSQVVKVGFYIAVIDQGFEYILSFTPVFGFRGLQLAIGKLPGTLKSGVPSLMFWMMPKVHRLYLYHPLRNFNGFLLGIVRMDHRLHIAVYAQVVDNPGMVSIIMLTYAPVLAFSDQPDKGFYLSGSKILPDQGLAILD